MISNKLPGHRAKHVFLLPLWIHQRLNAKALDAKDVLDFNRISQMFSLNDLASIVVLQEQTDYIVGGLVNASDEPTPEEGTSRYSDAWSLKQYWEASALTEQQRTIIGHAFKLAKDATLIEEVKYRLFSNAPAESANSIASPIVRSDKEIEPFLVNDVDTDICIVTIKPGYFATRATNNDAKRLQVRALEAILRSFYRSLPAHDVHRTVWFTRYIEMLNGM